MISKYTVDLPYAPLNLKYGFESDLRYEQNRQYALALLQGRTRLIQTIQLYERSALEGDTILHYRDYLLALAFSQTLVNTQYTTSYQYELTTTANKAWETYSYDDIWLYRPLNKERPDYRYAGLLGQPAYWFTKLSEFSYDLLNLEKLCNTFWLYQGIDVSKMPREKIQQLRDYINPPVQVIKNIQEKWQYLFEEESTLRTQARRYLLDPSSLNNFQYRVLYGDYSSELFNVVYNLANEAERKEIERYKNVCVSIAKPSGMLLVWQFCIVEGLTKAAKVLTELGRPIVDQPLTSLDSDTAYEVALRLAMVYDAANEINNIKESLSSQRALELLTYFLSSSSYTTIPINNPYRLEGII